MDIREKRFVGFSLAEALITLLIISIITLASVPVITKKHRATTKEFSSKRQKWICTLNSSGQHVYWQTGDANYDNIDAWKTVNGYCTFNVPKDGKNFLVTASAGGGGGAMPSYENICYYTAGTHPIKYPGKYTLFALGSGGCSGGTPSCISQGGGAGGISYGNIDVTNTDKSFVLSPASKCDNDGDRNTVGNNGNTSTISIIDANDNKKKLIEAYGGKGGKRGERRWSNGQNKCQFVGDASGKQGSGKIVSDRVYNGETSPNYNNSEYVDAPEFGTFWHKLEYISDSNNWTTKKLAYGFLFGHPPGPCNTADGYWMADKKNSGEGLGSGGRGREGADKDDIGGPIAGTKGSTQVGANICHQADAGRAGQAVSKQLYSFDKTKYTIKIGAGGRGAGVYNYEVIYEGANGGHTEIEGLFILSGGEGGKQNNIAGKAETVKGLDGDDSLLPYEKYINKPYGGLSGYNTTEDGLTGNGFGSGGGSGACVQKDASTVNAYVPLIGKGGRGQNGVVIIEW